MRPIEKSRHPRDHQQQILTFPTYQHARGPLLETIGSYCSYCERPLSNPAVEHKMCRQHHPHFELKWNNFLLSCTNCNSTKAHHNHLVLLDCIWPDRDNTYLAFVYTAGGNIEVNSNLPTLIQERAQRTLDMTGIHRKPSLDIAVNPTFPDQRWKKRREAWNEATDARQDLQEDLGTPNEAKMKKHIINQAKATGYWSIWMTVFHDDPDMKKRLIDAFTGTSSTCFDATQQPVPRRRLI
ncbi:HNH endonuclease [Tumebacillus sp. ITR2]|uniref:HNH endonuclease n=1 Tax=Tumebacillus amylolyticus TaxID=2801339 RepID=A0ABS1J5I6_9BACL|nr:HNH endonuclease [Tumebacillus amylolyticus]MBL0385294.1 HNH endonuclease [Tumebacillus amylolyticus]